MAPPAKTDLKILYNIFRPDSTTMNKKYRNFFKTVKYVFSLSGGRCGGSRP